MTLMDAGKELLDSTWDSLFRSSAPAPVSASAPAQVAPEAAPASDASVKEKLRKDLLLPGVTLSEGISQVTGVAVSPLLGVSVMGAWTYYRTAPELRHRLPWYCTPYVWGVGMSILALCFLKDFLGTAAPALAKKPLDFIELFEDKASALVASTAFVPLVALAVSHMDQLSAPQALNQGAASGLAVMPMMAWLDFAVHTPWLSIPLAMMAFGVVWLSSHALNVLIALSPFGIVDAGLKLTKLALLSIVIASAVIHPYLGAAISLILILIGAILAGWSFRLTLFGTLMGRDFLLNKRASKSDLETGVKGFLARRTEGIPVRTFGKLESDAAGRPQFVWKPWLILPRRRVTLSGDGMILCRGLLHPSVSHRRTTEDRPRHALILLPRYRRLEEAIASRFGCQDVVDSALIRGFKAIRQWLVDAFSTGRNLVENRASAS